MATCNDCICYEILCRDTLQDNELQLCESFKNKADFVEVVRCKGCTRRVDYEGMIMCNKFGHKFQGEWYGLRATTEDHFCSYGERDENK